MEPTDISQDPKHFQTIESILKPAEGVHGTRRRLYFQTIESILKHKEENLTLFIFG